LGENPVIRFYRPLENSHPARSHAARLAQLLQVDLDDYARGDPEFPPPGNRPRASLLIFERGFDVITPLLHEFTYQAMANDLLPIEEGKTYKYEFLGPNGMEEKKSTIDDKDTVWTDVRHMHMKDTIDKLMQDFNKFCQDNTVFTNKFCFLWRELIVERVRQV
jgi:syntaxin-binding protein 1